MCKDYDLRSVSFTVNSERKICKFVLYLTAVQETEESYNFVKDTASITNCVEKQLTYQLRHVPPRSPDIILKHALRRKIVHYENPTFFSINLKSAIQDLLNELCTETFSLGIY